MTTQELYHLLQLPQDAIARLNDCAQSDLHWLTPEIKALYFNRATAGDGLKAMQAALGEDRDGMRLLWVLLEMARDTWNGYVQRGISLDIFSATMGFVPRFLRTHLAQQGSVAFVWG